MTGKLCVNCVFLFALSGIAWGAAPILLSTCAICSESAFDCQTTVDSIGDVACNSYTFCGTRWRYWDGWCTVRSCHCYVTTPAAASSVVMQQCRCVT